MRPTLDLLNYQLKKKWDLELHSKSVQTEELYTPLLYDGISELLPNHVYISLQTPIAGEHLPPSPICLITHHSLKKYYKNIGHNVLFIHDDVTEAVLFNEVLTIFWRYAEWEHQMQQIIERQGSIQQLLDIS